MTKLTALYQFNGESFNFSLLMMIFKVSIDGAWYQVKA